MSNDPLPFGEAITEDDIHAYVDAQLSPARRAEVEAFLAAHPQEAQRVEAYRGQNIALHSLFDSQLHDPVPVPMLDRAEAIGLERRRRSASRGLTRAAASLVALLLGGSALWYGFDSHIASEDPLVAFTRRANDAHLLLADRIIAQQGGGSGAAKNAVGWLAQTLTGAPVGAPDLEAHGMTLVAQRILPTETGPAVQLLYRGQEGHRISLYVGASANHNETAFTFLQRDDISQFYWQNAGFAYSLIGHLQREDLLELAESISDGLSGFDEAREEPGENRLLEQDEGEPASSEAKGDVVQDSASLGPVGEAESEAAEGAIELPAGESGKNIIPVGTEPAGNSPEIAPADTESKPLPKESQSKPKRPEAPASQRAMV